jgi:hypothetical protein
MYSALLSPSTSHICLNKLVDVFFSISTVVCKLERKKHCRERQVETSLLETLGNNTLQVDVWLLSLTCGGLDLRPRLSVRPEIYPSPQISPIPCQSDRWAPHSNHVTLRSQALPPRRAALSIARHINLARFLRRKPRSATCLPSSNVFLVIGVACEGPKAARFGTVASPGCHSSCPLCSVPSIKGSLSPLPCSRPQAFQGPVSIMPQVPRGSVASLSMPALCGTQVELEVCYPRDGVPKEQPH